MKNIKSQITNPKSQINSNVQNSNDLNRFGYCKIGIWILFVIWCLGFGVLTSVCYAQHEQHQAKDIYYCPMHPDFTSDKPGSCSICGMTLVKKEKKIIFYRNPMNPEVTSPTPMKDSMGMDYAPVYEDETAGIEAGIYMSQEKQQMIGVKKENVEKRKLTHEILTVGKVAYDPALYVAQEEYLQAQKVKEKISENALPSVKEQTDSLVGASRRKLLLMGMNEQGIMELAKKGKPQENLYLPTDEGTVWVYMTIYEYESGFIKEGLDVEIDSVAFPGEIFKGVIASITPVLDSMTRSIQARTEVRDPDHKLKPEMFVNAKINVDLGEKLAVPEEAVLDTGVRKIVYVVKEGDLLEQRDVALGQKADGFYEVLDGLKEGEAVVISGNFLVDSESKLKSSLKGAEHKHGQ